jgi:hypothetical protein
MSFSVAIDGSGPWLVIEYAGVITGTELVSARSEAASMNADSSLSDFIIDFTEVSEFVLSSEAVEDIHSIDLQRSQTIASGRCALVVMREIIEIGATFLAAVSPLKLDYRTFSSRSEAESWLRGTLSAPPPPLPRRS